MERRTASVGAVLALTALFATSASPAAARSSAVSPNWAGYAATSPQGRHVSFTRVSGSWRQPTVRCGSGEAGSASAVWVGLGGYGGTVHEVEQVGADANCDAAGRPRYYAWFEVVPYPAYTVDEPVGAGDSIAASVEIVPGAVRLRLENRTRRWTFDRTISWASPDTSSAEWIVEAPATCVRFTCSQPHLANFGSVEISKVGVRGNSLDGTLAGTGWKVTPIRLVPATQHFSLDPGGSSDVTTHPARHVRTASAGAAPSPFSADGSAFTITRIPPGE